ncbi:MAG: hypothetical protein WCU00_07510, partial [Candidatus Latescibacterota bacterium]
MAKGKLLKSWVLFLAGAAMLIMAESGYCQLLFKSGSEAEYYGKNGYNKYGRSLINKPANPKYDDFGKYIMDGVGIFSWNEEKRQSAETIASSAYSSISKQNASDVGEYYRAYLNNLVVVNESSKSFSSRLIVGDQVNVKFSPLTLDMAALNGVRWDMNFNENNLTFVSSRADIPLWLPSEFNNVPETTRLFPVYLTGGHFSRQFGIFNVAANYVNTYKSDSAIKRTLSANSLFSDISDSITGTMPESIGDVVYPEEVNLLVVKFEDGSRFDSNNGPRIYDLYPIVEGQPRKDLLVGITRGNWQNDFYDVRKLTNNPALDFYENTYMLDPERIPQYKKFTDARQASTLVLPEDYIMLRKSVSDPIKDFGSYTGTVNKYFEVNSNDYLLFWFEIPKKQGKNSSGVTADVPIENVEFKAKVANDYKISMSEVYKDQNQPTLGNQMAKYYYVVKEAPGNIKDLSNMDWISFKYGIQLADMIMGIRIESNIKGFSLLAEFNKNLNFRQYPHSLAPKYSEDANAYYINVKKEFNKFTIGTEYFNIDPDYSTSFHNADPAYRSMQEVPYSSWSSQFLADYSTRGGGGNSPVISSQYMNNTMIIDTVDDNDDKDIYPDFHLYSSVRDMNGVFPGLDANGD